MKIAIHHRKGSFSERWIDYCEENKIDYKIVNAFDSNIMQQIKDCGVFMWHHHHNDFKDALTAKRILFSLEHAGIKVFPDFKTGWHFDDKVSQKYLLEAIGAPIVRSHVFYDKQEAIAWARKTTYPKVFKLKGGAGASNVMLAKSMSVAISLINKSFGKGFSQFDRLGYVKDNFKKYKSGQRSLKSTLRSCARLFFIPDFAKNQPVDKGYAYFQDFIPNNDSDLRVIIIDNKAFAVKRMVREGDFRASGSGIIVFAKEEIDLNCIKIAFDVSKKLNTQSVAFDFVWGINNEPYLVELSYGFAIKFYDPCPGYWDKDMRWHKGDFNPQGWIIEALLGTN